MKLGVTDVGRCFTVAVEIVITHSSRCFTIAVEPSIADLSRRDTITVKICVTNPCAGRLRVASCAEEKEEHHCSNDYCLAIHVRIPLLLIQENDHLRKLHPRIMHLH